MDEPSTTRGGGLLDLVERVGNKLPDPITLFLIGTIVVMVLSHAAAVAGWQVEKILPEQVGVDAGGEPILEWKSTGEVFGPTSLLDADGLFWSISSLVDNFMDFPPLGVVLVGMLGIGIAERVGLIGALLKAFMALVPGFLLTPAMVFLGVMSSMGIDAGYVVLPPLAAALYKASGRSPLTGIAAVFAGVGAGFNANLFVTGLDPMLANFTATGAQVLVEDYRVNPACNWWFMIVSTFVITIVGWGVTSFFVERRLQTKTPDEGGPVPADSADLSAQRLGADEKRGLAAALTVLAIVLAAFGVSIFVEGFPLFGKGNSFDRWAEAIVPMIFLSFLLPALTYGWRLKQFQSDKDVAKLLIESIAAMAPIIVLSFFAAQFIEYFKHSGLDKMLALWGGQALGQAQLTTSVLIVAFIFITMAFNLFVGSMSAKYAMFAPIFVPMFMLVGISPELTQAAYRIGDSVSNTITPLNPYMVIMLVFMQRFVPKGGIGTLISTMLPYSVVFTVVWIIMIVVWITSGVELGPDGPLGYALP